MNENRQHNRFKDAPWYPNKKIYIIIGGAGGIGSWVSLLISRAGFIPVIFDDDIVEEHNLGGQAFFVGGTNKPKVIAITEVLKQMNGSLPIAYNQRIDEQLRPMPYMIAAFDNISSRKLMFERWVGGDSKNGIFIDGRLEAEHMWIYCIRNRPEDIRRYREILEIYNDDVLQEAACTFRQTSHSAAMIASHIVGFFTNHITNVIQGEEVREIPFKWEYYIPLDLIERRGS